MFFYKFFGDLGPEVQVTKERLRDMKECQSEFKREVKDPHEELQ